MIYKDILILNSLLSVNDILEFKFPIPLRIKQDKEKTYYYVECERIGLFVIAETFEDILDMTAECLMHLWKEYIENTSEKLTSRESEIIRKNLEFCCTKRYIFNTDIN
jgi:hypothetical protein